MPRRHHRRRGTRRPNRPLPSLRIARGRSVAPDVARDDATPASPLDALAAVQPSDLVPLATLPGSDETAPIILAGFDPDAEDEPSLQEYIQRIEQSAARLRAEQAGEGRAGVPTLPQATRVAAPRDAEPARQRARRGRGKRRKPVDKRPWYRRRRTWVMVALVLPLLFVVAASAYVLNIVRLSIDAYGEINEPRVEDRDRWRVNAQGTAEPVPESEVEAVLPDWENNDPVNIVLLGVDAREGEELPPRSDTTIVAQIDPATSQVTMMSIPRDLIVFIPGFGEDKFNAAYPIGEANADEIEGGGTTLVASTIEANFNIPIHYYVTIDFDGFEKVVDTVGGVMIDVPYTLSDNQYPTSDLRLTRIYFPEGLQKMDGEKALQYVRTRHADSDFGRSNRQQQVLMAIREQAIGLELFARAPELIGDMKDTVRTDLVFNEMIALANLGRDVAEDDIVRFNLWEEGLLTEHNPETEDDAYYLEADWAAVLDRTEAFFGEGPAPVEDTAGGEEGEADPDLGISVFVENATDIPLLAGNSAQILVDAGFEAVWPSDAREPHEFSVIEAPDSQMATAQHIASLLGLPSSAIVGGQNGEGITVILGADVPKELIPSSDQVSQ